MDQFNHEDFIDFQRRQPPRNPPPPPQGGQRPGPGPFPGTGGPGPFPGSGPVPGNPSGSPRTAPPNYTPSRAVAPFRVDPSSIRNCRGSFTYVWLSNGEEFWMYPIQISRNTVSGFRWSRFFGWTFFGVSLNRIDAFMCI